MYTCFRVKYPFFRQILIKPEFSSQILEKSSTTKFHENPSSGSRDVPCGRTDGRTDAQTENTKLIVACRNSANAPKQRSMLCWCVKVLTWLVKLIISTFVKRCCIIDCYTCLCATNQFLSEQFRALRTHITCCLVFHGTVHKYATLIWQIRTIGQNNLPAFDNSLFVTPRPNDRVTTWLCVTFMQTERKKDVQYEGSHPRS